MRLSTFLKGMDLPGWGAEAREMERENERLRAEVEDLKRKHCKDCCCAKSWEALGITEYTGLRIPEEIEKLRAELLRIKADTGEWDAQQEIERLRAQRDAATDALCEAEDALPYPYIVDEEHSVAECVRLLAAKQSYLQTTIKELKKECE